MAAWRQGTRGRRAAEVGGARRFFFCGGAKGVRMRAAWMVAVTTLAASQAWGQYYPQVRTRGAVSSNDVAVFLDASGRFIGRGSGGGAFAPLVHTHDAADVTDAPWYSGGDPIDYSWITNPPSLFSGAWGDLSGKPTVFPPDTHTHDAADVTNAPWLRTDGTTPMTGDLNMGYLYSITNVMWIVGQGGCLINLADTELDAPPGGEAWVINGGLIISGGDLDMGNGAISNVTEITLGGESRTNWPTGGGISLADATNAAQAVAWRVQHTPTELTSAATVTVSEASGPWFRLALTNSAVLVTSGVDTNTTAGWKLDVLLGAHSLTLSTNSFTNRITSSYLSLTNQYQTIWGSRPYGVAITEAY